MASCDPNTAMPLACLERIDKLSDKIDKLASVPDILTRVEAQTTKTNGKVAALYQAKDAMENRLTAIETTAKVQDKGGDKFWKIITIGVSICGVAIAVIALIVKH